MLLLILKIKIKKKAVTHDNHLLIGGGEEKTSLLKITCRRVLKINIVCVKYHPYLNLEFMMRQEQSFTGVTHLCCFVPHIQHTNNYLVTGTPNESPFIWLVAYFIGLQKLDFNGWE